MFYLLHHLAALALCKVSAGVVAAERFNLLRLPQHGWHASAQRNGLHTGRSNSRKPKRRIHPYKEVTNQ